jgi:ABC-2 type transport system ATP-binding protein
MCAVTSAWKQGGHLVNMEVNTAMKNNTILAVEAHGLVKTFGDTRAVDGVSLSIPTGSICAVLGPNGAGKTTTINMLATLSKPDAGNVKIFGYDVVRETHIVRQLIGLTGQFASIDEDLTAMENLMIFGRLYGYSRKDSKRKANELLEEFGLSDVASRALSKFSGGMRRRLDLAVSLISQPPLIFLDEPTTGLDPTTRTQMWQTIRNLVKGGSTVLLTTQYLDEADQLADNIVVIDKGRVVANDTPDGLKRSVGSSSLHLTVKDADNAANAAQIIERILDAKVHLAKASELIAPIDNIDKLTDVLTTLKDAGIALSGVNILQPTLDEVFMALTGEGSKDKMEKN